MRPLAEQRKHWSTRVHWWRWGVHHGAVRSFPTTVEFPRKLPVRHQRGTWWITVNGVDVELSNPDKLFWGPEGYTKGDLIAYYYNIAECILPVVCGRPLTLKRMPDGADGDFFYAKQAPAHTPDWLPRAPVTSVDSGKTVTYLLADDTASLLYLANLGCIELHPWHSRIDALSWPDYALFDLDPFDIGFDVVREVALLVRTALDQLGLRGYPRTSGATGMQVYVPIDRVHSADEVREWVGGVCRIINRAAADRTTMEWSVSARTGKVFLDHGMNTEGKNVAATYCLRPERGAPVATPLTWEEVIDGVEPRDFTITTIWSRLADVGDLWAPVLAGGQNLRAAMSSLGMPAASEPSRPRHVVGEPRRREPLGEYASKRDFSRTPEPPPAEAEGEAEAECEAEAETEELGNRFVIQHHLARRLHHDLRLEYQGTAKSWAIPKGLPDVPGLRHLAVQTEDHPLAYLSFEGDIPEGEYGAGPMRIWDQGTYELREWSDDKVTFVLHGRRHHGEWHLFRAGRSGGSPMAADRDRPDQWLITRADEPGVLVPPPPQFSPMLAVDGDEPFNDDQWLFDVKWNGIRAIAQTIRPGAGDDGSTTLHSRLGNDLSAAYPELASLWERVLARNAVLDGEIIVLGPDGRPSFTRLAQRMHLREPRAVERVARATPVTYMIFDVLAVDGEAVIDQPLAERLELLAEILVPGGRIQRSEPIRGEGIALFEAVEQQGLEGVIAKRADSVYRPGRRSRDWVKLKVRQHVHVVIGGWLGGQGGRGGRLGSLLAGLYDGPGLRFVGRVGTGFDDAELEHLGQQLAPLKAATPPFADPAGLPAEVRRGAHWVEPRLVCRVEFNDVTEDIRLRGASYKGLTDHLDPHACTLDDLP
jgi:bifunctional non-homologous end joining protein LigD